MPFQPAELRNKVVLSGSFSGGSATHPGPVLKTAKGERMESPELSNEKHYMLQGNSLVGVQFTPDPKNAGVITASFRPPGTGESAVDLPFHANDIASAVAPRNEANVKYFSAVNSFDQRAKQLRAGETACGTSVIGFQVGSGWEFWYQTWGKLKTGVTYSVLDAQKFWW